MKTLLRWLRECWQSLFGPGEPEPTLEEGITQAEGPGELPAVQPATTPPPYSPPVDPPWMAIARGEMGTQEQPGPTDNPRIIAYHATTTLHATTDEVPWCSSFVSWCIEQAGIRGTRSAAARSWLTWGEGLEHPILGCIVVLSRGSNPAAGHVGFWMEEQTGRVQLLGGNQGNAVSLSTFDAARILGYRWPLQG